MEEKIELEEPKKWLSFKDQIEHLKVLGLNFHDENKAIHYLKHINYYRLSGYFYPFRQNDPLTSDKKINDFIEDSYFEDIKELYIFDKELRLLALDALERIEIAIRTNIAHSLGKYDPLAYREPKYFSKNFRTGKYLSWVSKSYGQLNRSKNELAIKHHLEKYDGIPIWVIAETWDFGTMSNLFAGMQNNDKNHIAKLYHIKEGKHLESYLHAFNVIRNTAAHHSRLWNKSIPVKGTEKGFQDPQWKEISNNCPFFYFCLMKKMLDVISPNSTWGERFISLLDKFPKVQNNAISLADFGLVDMKHIDEWDLWNNK